MATFNYSIYSIYSIIIILILQVDDINDNAPTFDSEALYEGISVEDDDGWERYIPVRYLAKP